MLGRSPNERLARATRRAVVVGMSRGFLRIVLIVVAASWSGSASAQGTVSSADGGATDEATSLEQQLARDYDALSTSDCAVACQALGSMHRAADRLCGLDPGPRCSGARAKVADAENRVRAACPDCAIAAGAPALDRRAEAAPPAAPPPEAPGTGGCAGCAIDGDRDGASGLLATALACAAFCRRRRRRTEPRAR